MKVSRFLLSCILVLILIALQSPSPAFAEKQTDKHCLENNRVCVQIRFDVTCDGWRWEVTSYTYGEPNITVWATEWIPWSDQWNDPYALETDILTFRFTVRNQSTGATDGPYVMYFQIKEPGTCPVAPCTLEPLYYMYTLYDSNQPETWQPFCYVISDQGFPSVERQAQICSVDGFDHTYQATHGPYSGWVSRDCRGNIKYGWPDWKAEWYRSEFAVP
jgi:hypothetical protein